MSLQPDENNNDGNNQDELQNSSLRSADLSVDSNALLVPVRHVEEQNIRHNTEQEPQYLIQGSSALSTTNTTIPQPSIQPRTSRNYDPPPPPESDTYTFCSTSQQPSSFITNITGLMNNTRPRFTFQSPSTPESTSVTTHPYTQAQNTSDPKTPTTFNMIHPNPPPNNDNSRTLPSPPLQTIPTNPLQNNLSSTNTHNTQHSIEPLEHKTVTSKNSIQHQIVPVQPTSSIRTNLYFTHISQIPTNTNNLQTNTSLSNYHITYPYAQPSTTISNPTYINSSSSISEPFKPFDCGNFSLWRSYKNPIASARS